MFDCHQQVEEEVTDTMIKKIQHCFDVLVYLIHRTCWNLASHWGRVHGLVLMYHHITDEEVNIMPSCKHSPTVFRGTIERLLAEGYVFVSLDRMMEILEKKEEVKFAVITFDDIMDDVYTNALPILRQLRLPYALFVAPGLIGTDVYITREHLLEMDQDPLCTVGAHSITHSRLRKAHDPVQEIAASKRQLETLLGHKVDMMAYPFGWDCDVSRENMRQAREAGYRCAFGTIQSPVSETSSKNLFYLPRVVLMS